jgi:hypothetical protein
MKALKATAMDHSHYVRIHMTAKVPAGTTLADVSEPSYWANHAFRLKPGAIIEVVAEDNSLDCDLRVLEVGQTFAKVRVIRNYVEPAVSKKSSAKEAPEGVSVDYGGKQDRWRVVHKGEVIKSGLATESEAAKAAEEYRSKIAA